MSRVTAIYMAILGVLLLVAGVRLVSPKQSPTIAFKLPAIKADDVTRLVITKGSQVTTLERRPDDAEHPWYVGAPIAQPADRSVVETILQSFETETTMDLKLTADPKEHEAYEVTAEKAVKLEVFKGEELITAFLVGKTATGGSSYLRPVNSQEVFRAKVVGRARLEKAPADWRDKKLFDIKQEDISRLEIVEGDRTLRFVQKDGKWAAEAPAGLALDQQTMTGILRAVATLRAADLPDKADGETGLSTPSMVVSLTLPTGQKVLNIGAEKSAGERWAQRTDRQQLFVIRDGSLAQLRKTDADLRDKTLYPLDPEQVVEVTAARGSKRVRLAKAERGWTVEEPKGAFVDGKALQTILASITTARINRFVTDAVDTGLGDAPLVATLKDQAGKVFTLTLGKTNEAGETFASRSESPDVVTVRDSVVNAYKKLLGEPIPKPAQPAPGGMPAGMGGLPPGMKLPPGMAMPPQ